MAGGDQALVDLNHFGDVLGGARLDVGGEAAEGCHVLVIPGGGAGGDLFDGLAECRGAGVDLVLDVGDVADIGNPRVKPAEQANQHVVDHDGAGVANMRAVVDRGAADIEADMGGVERDEGLAAAGAAVVEAEGHSGGLSGGRSGGFAP